MRHHPTSHSFPIIDIECFLLVGFPLLPARRYFLNCVSVHTNTHTHTHICVCMYIHNIEMQTNSVIIS